MEYKLSTPLSLIEGLSIRTKNILCDLGVITFKDIFDVDERSFIMTQNSGKKSLNELVEFRSEFGDLYIKLIEEYKENQSIDWEQRRYNLAKDIVLSAATNIDYLTEIQKRGWGHAELAQQAVKYADALIEELRKEE